MTHLPTAFDAISSLLKLAEVSILRSWGSCLLSLLIRRRLSWSLALVWEVVTSCSFFRKYDPSLLGGVSRKAEDGRERPIETLTSKRSPSLSLLFALLVLVLTPHQHHSEPMRLFHPSTAVASSPYAKPPFILQLSLRDASSHNFCPPTSLPSVLLCSHPELSLENDVFLSTPFTVLDPLFASTVSTSSTRLTLNPRPRLRSPGRKPDGELKRQRTCISGLSPKMIFRSRGRTWFEERRSGTGTRGGGVARGEDEVWC